MQYGNTASVVIYISDKLYLINHIHFCGYKDWCHNFFFLALFHSIVKKNDFVESWFLYQYIFFFFDDWIWWSNVILKTTKKCSMKDGEAAVSVYWSADNSKIWAFRISVIIHWQNRKICYFSISLKLQIVTYCHRFKILKHKIETLQHIWQRRKLPAYWCAL